MAPFELQDLDGTLDPATWTAIIPPGNFDGLLISNLNGSATLTVKGASGGDTLTIPAGAERSLTPAPPRQNARQTAAGVNYRFPAGATVGYLKPGTGTGTGMFLVWA